ncbi:MAG: hypothetical protein R6X17_15860 [Candidatus Competibacteraceae bacterium]
MKISILSASLVLLASAPLAYSDTARERTQGPCFSVTVQNDPVNHSSVQQNCNRNYNRTVQAGRQNRAQTIQTGETNDNKARQYRYDPSKYLDRLLRN